MIERKYQSAEIAVKVFAPDQARLFQRALGRRHWFQSIFLERARIFVLLVVAKSVVEVPCQFPFPLCVNVLLPDELEIELFVDVFLVFIETGGLAVMLDDTVGVVSAVGGKLFPPDSVPGMVSVFFSAEADEAHRRFS